MKTFRHVAAAVTAGALLVGSALAAPTALAGKSAAEQAGGTTQATVTVGERNVDPAPMWREKVAEHPDRVKEMWAYSPSMNRHVPLFVITPKDNSQPRPTIYMLNGGDGGEGRANWVMQTDIVDFYMDKNVNVVIPMAGKFSYYTDWEQDVEALGGKQTWETFLTKELPGPLEKTLKASDKRAIAGMSMTATTSATPHDKILAIDPLVKNGLAEAALVDLVLPRVKSAREGIELVAKVLDEKGSAEGNIIVIADKNELWYMEILSGHQYAAIKYPDDKYSIYPNTFFMGNPYELGKGNYIVSKDLENVARKANHYREVNGKFHVANSYNLDHYAARNRSRAYAGLKLLDPQSKIGYFDHHFELLQSPSNPNQKYSLADAIAIQRNRFETLKEGFIPDDQYDKRGADGRPEVKAAYDGDTYKFAPGNENVIDAHIYQIKPDLPASMASILWLSNAPSRNTPYIPFYGTVTDTHPSFKPQDFTYNPDSFYWVAWHIDQMVMQNQNLFGSSIKQKWMALEKREEAEQRARDAKYRGKTDAQAAALSGEVTRDAIARTEKLFQEMKAVEKQMMQTIKAKGGKDDSIAVLQQKFDKQKADTVKTENASEGVTAK